jgi:hypothetical protein
MIMDYHQTAPSRKLRLYDMLCEQQLNPSKVSHSGVQSLLTLPLLLRFTKQTATLETQLMTSKNDLLFAMLEANPTARIRSK